MLTLFQVSVSLYMLVPLPGPPFLSSLPEKHLLHSPFKTPKCHFLQRIGVGASSVLGTGEGRGHAPAGGHIRISPGSEILIHCSLPPSKERIAARKTWSCLWGGGDCPMLWLLLECVLLFGLYWMGCPQFLWRDLVCHRWFPALSWSSTGAAPKCLLQWIQEKKCEGMNYKQEVHLFPRENSWKNYFPLISKIAAFEKINAFLFKREKSENKQTNQKIFQVRSQTSEFFTALKNFESKSTPNVNVQPKCLPLPLRIPSSGIYGKEEACFKCAPLRWSSVK